MRGFRVIVGTSSDCQHLRCHATPGNQKGRVIVKRTALLALGVFALGSVTIAQEELPAELISSDTGSVFFLGNDLGDQGATLWIAEDSLRIATPLTWTDGYALGTRERQEWDIADRIPVQPDPVIMWALAYADSLRSTELTQRQFIEKMAGHYRSQPDVEWVAIPHDNAVEIQYKRLDGPIIHPHMIRGTRTPPSAEEIAQERRDRQLQTMTKCADALRSGGVVIIGDGNFVLSRGGTRGAAFADLIRSCLADPDVLTVRLSQIGIAGWVARSFQNRRPLPGLR